MKTYDIFIDFECICGMFARKLNKPFYQIPLSYTIGYRNKQKEINTIFEIVNFEDSIPMNNNFINYVHEDFSRTIMNNINLLVKGSEIIKVENVNFIGWNPCLEEQILTSVFKRKIAVESLMKSCFEQGKLGIKREISLSKITKKGYSEKKYFVNFRKEIEKTLSSEEIEKLNLNHDGALASYSGFVLYNIIRKTVKTKYHIYISAKLLIKELEEYALDDIYRMFYFMDNLSEIKETLKNIKIVDELKREINTNVRLMSLLSEYNPNLKIKDLNKKLEKDKKDCEKKILLFEK
ncbi:MAG: hypothetical protein KFW07_02120 [Mycoplasmataceae bacterium]|nr:hypothetical protein [Mycoplasmataceae bacterium]